MEAMKVKSPFTLRMLLLAPHSPVGPGAGLAAALGSCGCLVVTKVSSFLALSVRRIS